MVPLIRSHLSVAASSQVHSKNALRNYGKTRRAVLLGWVFLKFTTRLVRTDTAPFRIRFEKAIANHCKPAAIKANPTTSFWSVYKKVADEHDNDMVTKYVEDLDTSLLFVCAISCARHSTQLSTLGGFILGCYNYVHCPNNSTAPAKPHRSDKRPAPPDIAAEHLVWRSRPTCARLKRPNQCPQGSVHPLRQSVGHIVRGIHRSIGQTMDPLLHSGHDVGEYCGPREGTPDQTRGTAEVGIPPDHGVVTRHVAVRAPPFWCCPYRLPMGSERFRRRSGIGGHFRRPRLLRLRCCDRDHLEWMSVPNTLIHYAPGSPAVDEGIRRACSRPAEALVETE